MVSPFSFFLIFLLSLCCSLRVKALSEEDVWCMRPLVKKDQRKSLVKTEYGRISAVEISDGRGRPYHLEFFTLEPNSLFLPVLLHADMVFYVHTGSGKLIWTQEDDMLRVNLQKGDIYRLQPGTIFYVQSNLEPQQEKLRISAIFADSYEDLHEPSIGAYSSISDLVRGFDKKVLQAAFSVSEEVIEEITRATKQPAIVHAVPKRKSTMWEWQVRFINGLLGTKGHTVTDAENKKRKTRTFNVLKAKPDFANCNGWSLTVTRKDLHALRGSNIGVFMVNLTKGSMMGPHWNPMATEIGMVIQGSGMVRVVCPSNANMSSEECKKTRFRVTEGDVFTVPRFHPMAQISFNNDSLVFVGFSTTTKKNHPQLLAGKASVLQTLDKNVLAASFNVANTTIDRLLSSQGDSIILGCTSCAEKEERIMEEEIERERQEEEARKREEEEARKREEEEARRREEEKEKEREREEEAARKKEEERRKEEEARRREEEEAKKKEEEAKRREEEEAQRRKEEETRRREEEQQQQQQQEEERRRQEAAEREEEEEAQRRKEEEARRREEEQQQQQQQEEERRRQEAAEREEEEARRQDEEREKKLEEEERRWQEEQKRRQEEKEAQRREQEKQEEEARREGGGGGGGGGRVLKKVWKA